MATVPHISFGDIKFHLCDYHTEEFKNAVPHEPSKCYYNPPCGTVSYSILVDGLYKCEDEFVLFDRCARLAKLTLPYTTD